MKKIKVSVNFKDERGEIIDMVENEQINAVTRVTFKKGAIRGNHFHEKTTQWNLILSGQIKVMTQIPGQEVVESRVGKDDFFEVTPSEHHAFQALEDTDMLVFTKGPRGGKEYESDTFHLVTPLYKK